MFRTVMETFLGLPKVADFVSVATEISLEDYKKLSYFERFALICESSDKLLGSQIIKLFFYFLKALSGEKFTASALKHRSEQNRAWRAIHGDNSVKFDVISYIENSSVDYYKLYSEREYIDIKSFIFESVKNSSQTLDEFLESLYIYDINSFTVSSSRFEYLRPNEYQAQLVYQKILSGEKCKKSEIGLLISHVICCVGRKKKCYLRFLADDGEIELEALTELFEKRNSDVEISICFNPFSFDLATRVFDLMLKKGKKISSEIIIPEDMEIDGICECLTHLLKTVPFSRIRLATLCAKNKFEAAIEIIRKNQSI